VADASGARDLVGDIANPAAFVAADSACLYFRLRINQTPFSGGTSYQPFAWAVEICTTSSFGGYQFICGVDGISNPDMVFLGLNTTQATPDSPSDAAEVLLATYSVSTHAQVVPAASFFGGDPDYFISWAIPRSALTSVDVTASTPLRLVFGSSNNSTALTTDLVSSTGANSLSGLVSDPISGAVPLTISGKANDVIVS